jgi:2-keto-4-pentenoate hydratase
MMDDSKIRQAARYLVQRYEARASLDIMLQDYAPTTVMDAYKVQDAFLSLLGQDRGVLGGYKIAYTSDEMRRLRGISSPCAGGMLAGHVSQHRLRCPGH